MTTEQEHWKGSPSQWLNFWHYVFAAIVLVSCFFWGAAKSWPYAYIGCGVAVIYMAWRFLKLRCHSFVLSNERLGVASGVLNQHLDELELYRVKDVLMVRSWWMRLTGLATLTLVTSDRTTPVLVIPAVANGVELRELLRTFVEQQREKKRVRELDFDEIDGGTIG